MKNLGIILGGVASLLLFSGGRKAQASATPPSKIGPYDGPPVGGTKLGIAETTASGDGDGAAWAASLPTEETPKRDEAILAAVRAGMGNFHWTTVRSSIPGYDAQVTVMTRVLRIGARNPVRVTVRYDTFQKIAELLGGAMMTPFVADLTYKQAKLPLKMQGRNSWVEDGTMGRTRRMIEYSQQLDALVPRDFDGLVANEGKHWIVCSRLWNDPQKGWNVQKSDKWSANYGWWDKGSPNGIMWQTPGLAHNWGHVDYSQSVFLMGQWAMVNGVICHVGAILADKKLCGLLSNEGPLPSWAHPAFGKSPLPLPYIPPLLGA